MITDHYYNHPLTDLHYYKFGNGKKVMLCFHGYGMHGKQFTILEKSLGHIYTFYGFDLFFHKQTKLKNQSIEHVKIGLSKKQLSNLITDFCTANEIDRFDILSYSMGTHYATVLIEEIPDKIDLFVAAAPASLKPGLTVKFFGKTKIGNKLLEKLAVSETAMLKMLNFCHRLGIVDDKGKDILRREVSTYDLRFSFYACTTYLRHFETDYRKLSQNLRTYSIKSIFFFGARDGMYKEKSCRKLISKMGNTQTVILDENHDMIKAGFAEIFTKIITQSA